MIVLIRILPVIIAVLHFFALRGLFYFSGQWYLIYGFLFLLDAIYFTLLFSKLKKSLVIFFLLHSLILFSAGFAFLMILSNGFFINLFLIFWSVVIFFYLESVFHFFYPTIKTTAFDLKSVLINFNLLIFFLLNASLLNFLIFLNLAWWWLLIVSFFTSLIILLSQFLVNQIDRKSSLICAAAIALLLAEILTALLFLPVSFYVLTFCLVLVYYLFSSFAVFQFLNKLNRKIILQYLLFAAIILLAVVLTTTWL